MSRDLRNRYGRLLRWYPHSWRVRNGAVMLATLEQDAAERGLSRPSRADVWSLRSHGLGERATPRVAAVFAAVSALAFAGAVALLLTSTSLPPETQAFRMLLASFAGPLGLSLAATALMHSTGRLSAPAALFTAVIAVPACALAGLSLSSIAVGFEEADLAQGNSWFGSASLLFVAAGWAAGTIFLLAPVNAVLRVRGTLFRQMALSALVAVPSAVVLGAMIMIGQFLNTIVAVVVLIVALRMGSGGTGSPADSCWTQNTASVGSSGPTAHAAADRRRMPAPRLAGRDRKAARTGALFGLVLGLACAAFALAGSEWTSFASDSTRAMNLGLGAGAVTAVSVVLSAGRILAPVVGKVIRWSVLLCCAALIMEAVAQLLGAGHPRQWPVTLVAASLMGCALVLPLGRLLPGGRSLRIVGVAFMAVAGIWPGLMLVAAAGFLSPVVAAVILVLMGVRKRARPEPGHQLSGRPGTLGPGNAVQ